MIELNTIKQHTAGPQAIGFDYQFYYFMFLSLKLTTGQKLGFEVKDDIHIDNPDGTTILFQAKHSIQKKADGSIKNFTDLDTDLWKTLANWTDFIQSEKYNQDFLVNTTFHLATNKGEGNNSLIDALSAYKSNNDIEFMFSVLTDLKNKTENKELKKNIRKVILLGKNKLKVFFHKLEIETDCDGIISKIKNRIHEIIRQEKYVSLVYDSLYSNLQKDKYLEICDKNKFEITNEDFNIKYGKCFQVAFENKPLPKRNLPVILPEDLEKQIFVKQLIDIGEVKSGSSKISDYTTKMLMVLNHFSYWRDNEFLLPSDIDEFEKESFLKWENEFNAKYRRLERRINAGENKEELEEEIQMLGCELLDILRKENFNIDGKAIGLEFSNGHLYSMSNRPQIGWHFDWKSKYK